ncbi:class I poly(R)-hydroxyalkanoic acid synthase [Psychrobium sp. MM17-31]|uniref:PHA/PHB synthase family protein n=1 Tax=Psychrobium sp. MM17-31 TaxID=2917758 RepID=UPI001EF6CC3B|nr:class I poly(R)-hydroxyalkanoic acid synthase [Psychrobium sp. MM17-31]
MKQTTDVNVLEYIEQFSEVFNQKFQQVLNKTMQGSEQLGASNYDANQFNEWLNSANVDSAKLINNQMAFMEQQMQLWQSATKSMLGESAAPVVAEEKGDQRFVDEQWSSNPVYSYIKQAYLLNSQLLNNTLESMQFADPKVAEQVAFYTRQYINAVSPTNSILTNPEVCREIVETKGENLTRGLDNFMEDLQRSPIDAFSVTQTDADAFTLGKDLATTPGKVVYENEFIQLIQYNATTEKVHKQPILITPPFINKYYILDLNERKSLVRWLVAQGHTVFIISWVNPDDSYRDKDFGDYMKRGPIAALDVVEKIIKTNKVNMVGWCVGGTLLTTAVAYLRAKGDERVNSLTLFTTLLDFSEPGEVGVYLSDNNMPAIEQAADEKGYFDGRILGLGFSMLRENNLFWSYFVNNYLKGKDPAPFDLLYWNSDPTNFPAAAFKQYLSSTYVTNQLKEAGGITIDGVAIDLAKIDVPCYFLSTIADHIVPWQGSYKGTQLVSGDTTFVLAGSGHLAGVINPADGGKYPHWTSEELKEDAQQWFAGATKHDGSWWPHWQQWLSEKSGSQVKARAVGRTKAFPAIEDAPGRYVRVRLDGK